MEGWTKISSFYNIYEAEIRKQLLQNAGIEAIVINAKDSLFLIGNIDLYVKEDFEKKAQIILQQMQGLTKINSFILKKPIKLFQDYLKSKGFSTILKERSTEKYILENYELYIENEKLNDIIPYLTGEKIDDWKKVKKVSRVRQARYRFELLDAYKIDSFIIKKRDSDFHLEEINLYVENENFDKANEILTQLKDWNEVKKYSKLETAELKEDLLGKNGIRALIVEKNQKYSLFVLSGKAQKAQEILNITKEWVELQRYNTFLEAESDLVLLEQENIDASILTIRDSVFIIGGYALYVEKDKLNLAMTILTKAKGGTIT